MLRRAGEVDGGDYVPWEGVYVATPAPDSTTDVDGAATVSAHCERRAMAPDREAESQGATCGYVVAVVRREAPPLLQADGARGRGGWGVGRLRGSMSRCRCDKLGAACDGGYTFFSFFTVSMRASFVCLL